jgi:hypothetical protein
MLQHEFGTEGYKASGNEREESSKLECERDPFSLLPSGAAGKRCEDTECQYGDYEDQIEKPLVSKCKLHPLDVAERDVAEFVADDCIKFLFREAIHKRLTNNHRRFIDG